MKPYLTSVNKPKCYLRSMWIKISWIQYRSIVRRMQYIAVHSIQYVVVYSIGLGTIVHKKLRGIKFMWYGNNFLNYTCNICRHSCIFDLFSFGRTNMSLPDFSLASILPHIAFLCYLLVVFLMLTASHTTVLCISFFWSRFLLIWQFYFSWEMSLLHLNYLQIFLFHVLLFQAAILSVFTFFKSHLVILHLFDIVFYFILLLCISIYFLKYTLWLVSLCNKCHFFAAF